MTSARLPATAGTHAANVGPSRPSMPAASDTTPAVTFRPKNPVTRVTRLSELGLGARARRANPKSYVTHVTRESQSDIGTLLSTYRPHAYARTHGGLTKTDVTSVTGLEKASK